MYEVNNSCKYKIIQECLITVLFNIILKKIQYNKPGNFQKGVITFRKREANLSLFADDMIVYIENP